MNKFVPSPTLRIHATGHGVKNGRPHPRIKRSRCGFRGTRKISARLAPIEITYPGNNNRTVLTYDGIGRCTKIVESGTNPLYNGNSTKHFLWSGSERCEQRDTTGSSARQYFARGQKNGSVAYFYSRDHLGSVRELVDGGSGAVVRTYAYSPFGESSKQTTGSIDADFRFAGMYDHDRSGLNLTVFRAYNSSVAKWLSRDPMGERETLNLYAYVTNDPVNNLDPLGLQYVQAIEAIRNNPQAQAAAGSALAALVLSMKGLKDLGEEAWKNTREWWLNYQKSRCYSQLANDLQKCRDDRDKLCKGASDEQIYAAEQVYQSCIAQALRDFGDCMMKAGFSEEEAQKAIEFYEQQLYGK